MPLVFALLVVWATPVTGFLLLPLVPTLHYEALLSKRGWWGGGDLFYMLMRSLINENATSGRIHQLALLFKVFK